MATLELIRGWSEQNIDFELTCKKCASHNVKLSIESVVYPETSWLVISIDCLDCEHVEKLYSDQ